MKENHSKPVRPGKENLSKIMKALGSIQDLRQESKVKYPISDVILLTVAAIAGSAKTWVEIEDYGKEYARLLFRYLQIAAIPSHDTIERVFSLISPFVLERIYKLWCGQMDFPEETPESLRGHKLLNLDGKTIRGSAGRGKRAVHIESAWDPQQGICLGQTATEEKSNEITAIPKLLGRLDLHGYIVTSDAMGTQTAIAGQIILKGGDYVLAVKGNQGTTYEDMRLSAEDTVFLNELKKKGWYKKTTEKAHGQIEIREYWQCSDLFFLSTAEKWEGLQSVGYERSTIRKDGKETVTWRFFLTSLPADTEMFAEAVRGHWRIEAMHNVLDVVLREDANKTVERTAAENQNILRKWTVTILRHAEVRKKGISMRRKNLILGWNPKPVLEMLTGVT